MQEQLTFFLFNKQFYSKSIKKEDNNMEEKINRAHEFAIAAHGDQERKFTGATYTSHIEETAQLVWEVTDGKAETDDYIAAILHDVVEDTDVSLNEVGRHFGKVVMDLVEELTIDPIQKKLEGKKPYLSKKMNTMSSRALTIKLCDRLSNVVGLEYEVIPKDFVKWYVKETAYLLDNLTRSLNDDQEYLINRIRKMLMYLVISRKL